ncbi:MAG: hypothetical protein GVY29_10410 [Spirochaetes bacterium]|jgi:ABC-type transport system substrate-binding protein|nr:hypothetical protein [Spirochaetota bacterium]
MYSLLRAGFGLAVLVALSGCAGMFGGGMGTLAIHSYSEIYGDSASELTESMNIDAILSIEPAIDGKRVFVTGGDGRLEIADVPVGDYTITPLHSSDAAAETVTVPRGVEVPVVVEIPRAGIYLYVFDHAVSNPPFNNADVRRAFNIAVERSGIGTALAEDPDLSFDSAPPMAYSYIPSVLEQSGWDVTTIADGNPAEAETLMSGVSPFSFELLVNETDVSTHETIAETVFPAIEELTEVGDMTPTAQAFSDYTAALKAGDFEFGRFGWFLDSNNLYRYFQAITGSVDAGATQYVNSAYESSELDSFLSDMKSALDQGDVDAYETAVLAVNLLLIEDAFAVPLYFFE